ncbi:MFS general substrate transporter [Mollisia scopiformis]|uniref:MFS general substrate transporter n=1 Tax=Mollisia scopiformis TaxID=149040 RepID=A0A194X5A2_MOLSC|nr:MFS general substrate transporter [Mollisia scopiformis]KUJ15350.1 MFS general substrate transporter [Mollisia scopiformis]
MSSHDDTPTEASTYPEKEPGTISEKDNESDGIEHVRPANDDAVDTNFQAGVQNIEAVTVTWSMTWLVIAYALIWIIYFIQGLVSGVTGALLPYVTSAFALHSLTPTVGILSAVIGGVTNLSIAKILDIFGRPQGFVFCIVLTVLGLIMSAACNNVEAYAASQVFYTVGINGIGYSLSVFVADTSSLRNRGLMQAFAASPNLITCWLAGPISTSFLDGAGWRWAFGMFCIIVPVVTLPLFGLFQYQYSRAKKAGVISKRESGRTTCQSIVYYTREFDALGLFLISAGVAFFLLPFNLYYQQAKGWRSALIISFLVVGILLLIAFVVWEAFFASISFFPFALLRDRTVLGAGILSFTLFISNSCWALYFSSVLQVVFDLSVTHVSYVVQIQTVGSVLTSLAGGAVISYTGRYKPISLYFGVPITALGMGLLIYFRHPDQSIGYIVMCQIFISFASGVLIITDEIAIMAAAVEQQYFAVSIAVLGCFGSIGSAIGLTISSTIWQDILPKKLALYLPAEELPNLVMIYGDLTTQLSYPPGSPTRLAIQHAYGDAQKLLVIAGTAVWVLGFLAVFMWRDIKVTGIKQTKGTVA